jgi:hypothetical protein
VTLLLVTGGVQAHLQASQAAAFMLRLIQMIPSQPPSVINQPGSTAVTAGTQIKTKLMLVAVELVIILHTWLE